MDTNITKHDLLVRWESWLPVLSHIGVNEKNHRLNAAYTGTQPDEFDHTIGSALTHAKPARAQNTVLRIIAAIAVPYVMYHISFFLGSRLASGSNSFDTYNDDPMVALGNIGLTLAVAVLSFVFLLIAVGCTIWGIKAFFAAINAPKPSDEALRIDNLVTPRSLDHPLEAIKAAINDTDIPTAAMFRITFDDPAEADALYAELEKNQWIMTGAVDQDTFAAHITDWYDAPTDVFYALHATDGSLFIAVYDTGEINLSNLGAVYVAIQKATHFTTGNNGSIQRLDDVRLVA